MVDGDAKRDRTGKESVPTARPVEPVAPAPATGDVTKILAEIEQGDGQAAEQLLPLVYDELRKLAAAKLAHERPGQTLQATALVHEAFLRLVDVQQVQNWNSRGHFFAAAAEAMRRIVVENARRNRRLKRGGQQKRLDFQMAQPAADGPDLDVLAVDEALTKMAGPHPEKVALVKLRYFGGFTLPEAAAALGISTATAERHWRYARAWLAHELREGCSAARE
jgi:RNA polymerase sigma factor (TIGR02999 family)